jgi:long-subunit fatty acid transport protein
VLWSPVEQVNLGAVVKTPFTADVTLFRTRTDASLVSTTPTTNTYSSNDVRIDFPRAFGVGISWRPRGTLQLALDYTRTQWSQGKIHNFFTLPPTPPGDDPPVPEPPDNVFPVLPYPTLDSTQTDDEQIRMGVEWVLLTRHFKLPLRIGYYNEGQNFRSATINVPRFDGFTVGAGVIVGPVLLDAAYIRLSGLYRDNSAFPITVLSHRWLVSAIYRHGSR